jgi:hypothetical protein
MYVRQAVGLVELRAWQCLSVWESNSETSRVDQRGLGRGLARCWVGLDGACVLGFLNGVLGCIIMNMCEQQ